MGMRDGKVCRRFKQTKANGRKQLPAGAGAARHPPERRETAGASERRAYGNWRKAVMPYVYFDLLFNNNSARYQQVFGVRFN
jgi:hypothetical protein